MDFVESDVIRDELKQMVLSLDGISFYCYLAYWFKCNNTIEPTEKNFYNKKTRFVFKIMSSAF